MIDPKTIEELHSMLLENEGEAAAWIEKYPEEVLRLSYRAMYGEELGEAEYQRICGDIQGDIEALFDELGKVKVVLKAIQSKRMIHAPSN